MVASSTPATATSRSRSGRPKGTRHCTGAALFELAVALPISMFIVLGIVQISFRIINVMQVELIAREAVQASVHVLYDIVSPPPALSACEYMTEYLNNTVLPRALPNFYSDEGEAKANNGFYLKEACKIYGGEFKSSKFKLTVAKKGAECRFCFGDLIGLLPPLEVSATFPGVGLACVGLIPPDCEAPKEKEKIDTR